MKKDEPKNSKNLRALLKFTLSTKGLTITELAKIHMKTTSNLCNAFYIPYPRGEAIIAAALDLQPWDLWPDRYGEDHKSNRKRGRQKSNTKNFEVKGKISNDEAK
jgi:Ner family transcriptional regulator